MSRGLRRAAGLAGACLLMVGPSVAQAAGLYVSDRGVRPMGRAGAFVAGADDLHAIWYNPAGTYDAGNSILFDATWVNYSASFTRRTQVIDGGGVARQYEYPTVNSTTPFLPIPTLAASRRFGSRFVGAVGLLGPYAALQTYPETVAGAPAASRYSLVSMTGSMLLTLTAGGAMKITDKLKVGLNAQLLFGSFSSTVMFNANPSDRFLGAPEDPSYDASAQMAASPILAPSGNLGVTYEFTDWLKAGVSGQLPYWINAPASVKTRLPDVALFDGAQQQGDRARVKFVLPPSVRIGVELKKRWSKQQSLAVEIAYVREFWSMHKSIDVSTQDMSLTGVVGFPSPFYVAPFNIPRNFRDANSFRLGGELNLHSTDTIDFSVRTGVSYETSAAAPAWVSPLTIDGNKVIPSIGAGIAVQRRLRFDIMFAKPIYFPIDVSPGEARVPRINPVAGHPTQTEPINGGSYRVNVNLFGLSAKYDY